MAEVLVVLSVFPFHFFVMVALVTFGMAVLWEN